jgi:hypothetical protein
MAHGWDCGLGFGASSDAIHSIQAGSIHLRHVGIQTGTLSAPADTLIRKCIARRKLDLVRSIAQRFFENLWKVREVYFGGYLSA